MAAAIAARDRLTGQVCGSAGEWQAVEWHHESLNLRYGASQAAPGHSKRHRVNWGGRAMTSSRWAYYPSSVFRRDALLSVLPGTEGSSQGGSRSGRVGDTEELNKTDGGVERKCTSRSSRRLDE